MRSTHPLLSALLTLSTSTAVLAQSCAENDGNQCLVGTVGYYSDSNCEDLLSSVCLYAGDVNENCAPNLQPNDDTCLTQNLPSTSFFTRILNAQYPNLQVEFYNNPDDCTSAGPPGDVNAVVNNDGNCVAVTVTGDGRGVAVAPQGLGNEARKKKRSQVPSATKSPFRRRRDRLPASEGEVEAAETEQEEEEEKEEEEGRQLQARADLQCAGWIFGSQMETVTSQQMASHTVNCPPGPSCGISGLEQISTAVTTMFSVTGGGGVSGIDVSTTFGMSYTESQTTSIQTTFSVPGGQDGFLAVFSEATLFSGTFSGCNTVTGQSPGTVLAVKANMLHYTVTISG